MRIPVGGGPVGLAGLEAAAARLEEASAPVVAAIARAQPLINPETVTSPAADRWSQRWQAEAAAVARYLNYTLPSDVRSAVDAAVRTQAARAAQAASTPGGGRTGPPR